MMRARIADRLETIEPYPRGRFQGRGIVVCAGGARMFLNAYVLLRILRETLRCALPIQLWHLGPQEFSTVMRALIDDLDVEPVDAFTVRAKHPSVLADGWQLKPYAVLHSRFEEILLLDADQVPVRDPAELFDWPQYKEASACSGQISSISYLITQFGDSAVLNRATARVLKAVKLSLQRSGIGAR